MLIHAAAEIGTLYNIYAGRYTGQLCGYVGGTQPPYDVHFKCGQAVTTGAMSICYFQFMKHWHLLHVLTHQT